MNTDLIPIVHATLDGGPCGYKTTSLKFIEKNYTQIPHLQVVFVEEAARVYLKANEDRLHDLTVWEKQVGIFGLQLEFEKKAREEADYMQKHGEKVLVLYDRSLKTNMAYMHPVEYNKLLEHFKMSEIEIEKRYTDKLHLMSTAVDKPENYIMDDERKETPEEAHAIDLRLQKIWHDTVVHDNSTTIEDKVSRVWTDVLNRIARSTVHF